MVWGAIIGAAASIGSAYIGSSASKKAGKKAGDGAQDQLDYQRETRDLARSDAAPYRMGGYQAYNRAMAMLGLPSIAPYVDQQYGGKTTTSIREEDGWTARRPNSPISAKRETIPARGPSRLDRAMEQAYGGGRGIWKTDPGYQFRLGEGMRGINRAASASGSLGGGELMRRGIRYNQQFASNEFSNVFNRVMAGAGMSQAQTTNSANATLQTGMAMGNSSRDSGYAQAAGTMGQANAYMRGINDLAQGGVFQSAGNWLQDKFAADPSTGGGVGGGGYDPYGSGSRA